MKHLGKTLKSYIEDNQLSKSEIAKSSGITPNYLSSLFKKETFDCSLLDRLCKSAGVSPLYFFDDDSSYIKENCTPTNQERIDMLEKLLEEKDLRLAEKERYIQILLKNSGTNSEQDT